MLRVAYSFPNRVGVPGIGTIAWHHVNGLIQLGAQVTLFCGSCEKPIPGIHRVIETMKVSRLRIPYRLLGNQRAYRLHDHLVSRSVLRLREPPDVVHCWPLGALKTLHAARSAGIPSFLERPNTHTAFAFEVVAREHDRLGLSVPSNYTHSFNAHKLALEKAEYAAADRLLCPSAFVAKTFLDQGMPNEKIVRHQYGFDPSRFTAERGTAPNSDRPFTMAFVGRCEPRKGLHLALQAWHASGAANRGRFLICGSFMDGYRDALQKWLDHPSIKFLGFVSNVEEVMRQSDVFVLPAVEEGSALVTYEARACGNVLLVSDATGAICNAGHDALVHKAGDLDDLTNQLRRLINAPEYLLTLRSNSLSGLDSLTWASAARTLRSCYDTHQRTAC